MQVYVFVAPNHSCRSSEKGQITLIYSTSIHAFMNSFIQYKCKLSGILGAVNAKVEKKWHSARISVKDVDMEYIRVQYILV